MRLATLSPGQPEIFNAPQGEGPSAGTDCVFVRLSQCNLHCVWCDTPYTWNFMGTRFGHRNDTPVAPAKFDRSKETVDLEIAALAERLMAGACRRLVITGGEPLLQQRDVAVLCRLLRDRDPSWVIEIETNGTLLPSTETAAVIDQFNVSPKLAHSGNAAALRLKPTVLNAFAADPRAIFKFVVMRPEDLSEVEEIVAAAGMPAHRVWLMPEGTDSETLTARSPWVQAACATRGYRFSDRLHIHLHGDTRGT